MKKLIINKNMIFSALSLIFVFSLFNLRIAQSQSSAPDKSLQKLFAAMQCIKYAYVDSVYEDELVESAIIAALKKLDPHSVYISKKNVKKANEPLKGSFEGVGITFQIYDDTIRVIAPIPGGPSEKVGIIAGDKIVKIDGEKATGEKINNQYVFDHLRGKKGTKVDVSVYRGGKKDLIDFTIKRDEIPINSIDATFMVTPDIGFIKVNRFSKTSIEEFQEAVKNLKEEGMEKLILDLRGNPGGYMFAGIELADEFLTEDKLLLYTEGLRTRTQKFYSDPDGSFEEGDLIVLVNEGSASSSEIVAGAVQDWDRGLILGRRSFGKGLVQKPFELPDSSVIRLTIARYHTPTGRCIQKPYDQGLEDYYREIYNRMKNGELVDPDSISFPDSLKYYTPAKRIVYGGGGIMPDIFVPWDSTAINDFFIDVIRKGVINSYVMDYVDDNRRKIEKNYPGFKDYKNNFEIDDKMFSALIEKAKEENIEPDAAEIEEAKKVLKYRIKALIARNIWDISVFYEIISDIDDEFLKAVEILEDPSAYKKLCMN